MSNIFSLSVSEIAEKIRNSDLNSVDLCKSYIEQINKFEKDVKAWAHFDKKLLLEKATEAIFAFYKKPGNKEAIEYEIRFYSNHDDAINVGIPMVRERVGPDAKLKKEDAVWTAGLKDARQCGGAGGGEEGVLRRGPIQHDRQATSFPIQRYGWDRHRGGRGDTPRSGRSGELPFPSAFL